MEPARSRREEYSLATRSALLESAATLFAEKGFAATSLDEVAARARVTKGAVYHHFANKQALFEAVLERLEEESCEAVLAAAAAAAAGAADAWMGVVAGLECFLQRCRDPLYSRLCFEEGPVVMGFVKWWDHGGERERDLVRGMLYALKADGRVEPDDLETLSDLLFGAMTAAALAIARTEDVETEIRRVREATLRLVGGLQPRVQDGRAVSAPSR